MTLTDNVRHRLAVSPSEVTAMTIVGRAVVAGVVGGLVTALFVLLVGEQTIDAAIAIEEASSATVTADPVGDADGLPEVGRSVQIAGGAVAVVLYGVLTGIVFGTALAALRHRLALADDFGRSVLLAATGFVAVALLPAIKYPANPPAVGDPDTIGERTLTYLTFVAAGLVLAVGCGMVHQRLRTRFDQPTAVTLSALVAIGGAVALVLAWPASPDAVPADFPADLLWRFRLQSLIALAIPWTVLGLGTGWLLTRRATVPHTS